MKLQKSDDKYDFYIGRDIDRDKPIYNIVPIGSGIPTGGYYNQAYIEKVKGVNF